MKGGHLIALMTNNDDDIYCFRLELIQRLLEKGCRVLISCPDGPKFEVMEVSGLKKNRDFIYDNPNIDRRGTNIFRDMKLLLHYRNLLIKYKPSIVLTYTAKPNVYASVAAHHLHIPVINNVTGFGSVVNENRLKRTFILWLFKKAYSKSSCIMFQNSANMALAKKYGMIRGRYVLIPGSGVNIRRFMLQEYPSGGNGIDGEKVIFNYIGRVLHDKGIEDYIVAAKRIKSKYPNTEFNILGFIEPTENYYEKKLEELKKDNIVIYRGAQKDVIPWIKRSHAIIHPSTYGEGMSNVLLESASSGRVIITTDNPGCKETVIEGMTGFIYQGGNVEELVEKIEQFLGLKNDTRRAMGECGRRYAAENFSRELVVNAYINMIAELIG